jgi:hypothetical protein
VKIWNGASHREFDFVFNPLNLPAVAEILREVLI